MSEPRVLALALAELRLSEDERSRWPEGAPFPIVAHVVPHREGVFLFDTGIGSGNAEVDELVRERWPIEEALAAHGVAERDGGDAVGRAAGRRRPPGRVRGVRRPVALGRPGARPLRPRPVRLGTRLLTERSP